jgi:hypothetical protein
MPASVSTTPMVASSVAGEPVAGSWAGATAGTDAGAATSDTGRTRAGAVGGGGGTIEARGVDDELDDESGTLDAGAGTIDACGGTIVPRNGIDVLELEELDDELELLDDDVDDELELDDDGVEDELVVDDELDELGGTHSLLELDEVTVEGSIDGPAVWAEAGPHSMAAITSATPPPNTDHPALALRFMTPLLPPAWACDPEGTPPPRPVPGKSRRA